MSSNTVHDSSSTTCALHTCTRLAASNASYLTGIAVRFVCPILQIKLLKLLRLLCAGDKAASDNCAAVVSAALRRAASGGNHTIGHAIVYEAVRCVCWAVGVCGLFCWAQLEHARGFKRGVCAHTAAPRVGAGGLLIIDAACGL